MHILHTFHTYQRSCVTQCHFFFGHMPQGTVGLTTKESETLSRHENAIEIAAQQHSDESL